MGLFCLVKSQRTFWREMLGRVFSSVQCVQTGYGTKEKLNELFLSHADWSSEDTQIFTEFHFTFSLKPKIAREDNIENANGEGGRKGTAKGKAWPWKKVSANFRRSCVNSSNTPLRRKGVREGGGGLRGSFFKARTDDDQIEYECMCVLGVALPWRMHFLFSCLFSL